MIHRFLTAQEGIYPRALAEIASGKKQTHWIWYIFPHLQGLGKSETACYYGLVSQQGSRCFLAHPVLGTRLLEITKMAMQHTCKTPLEIFGHPDDLKFHSSLTLFNMVSPAADTNVFAEALQLFFAGSLDSATLALLQ